jgi:hypothetical protein
MSNPTRHYYAAKQTDIHTSMPASQHLTLFMLTNTACSSNQRPFETKATGARDPVAEHTHDRQPFPASCTKHPVTGPYARTHTHAHTHTHTYHHHHHHHHLGECTGSFPLCFNPFCSMKMLFALTGAAGERQFGFHVCWSREKWATKPARVDLVTPSLPVKHGREPHPSIVV